MGLDMYLEKDVSIRVYGSTYFIEKEDEARNKEVMTCLGNFFPELNKITDNEANLFVNKVETVGYWRKANAIHNWFVKNVQNDEDDCGRYKVELKDFEKLLSDIKKVLNDKSDDYKVALELLPPTSGFFFGGTDIDEYYFTYLKDTKEICEKVIREIKEINEEEDIKKENKNDKKSYLSSINYYYASSW